MRDPELPSLPPTVLNAVLDALYRSTDREAAIGKLCAEHPAHADAIRVHAAASLTLPTESFSLEDGPGPWQAEPPVAGEPIAAHRERARVFDDVVESLMRRIVDLPEPEQVAAAEQFCKEHPEAARMLRELIAVAGDPPSPGASERLEGIKERSPRAAERYQLRGEVARGGMGAILRAYDQDLRRTLAM